MDANVLITVVVPCYNQEEYVVEALESVRQQEHRPLQLIVINDGSTDESEKRIQKWLSKYGSEFSASYVTHTNQGVIASCNTVLNDVKGRYLVRLDGDDKISPRYISSLYHSVAITGADFAYSDSEYFGDKTGLMSAYDFSLARLVTGNYIPAAALVSVDVLRAHGWYDPTMIDGLEDWDLWLRLAGKGCQGVYCSESLARLYYRQVSTRPGRNSMGDRHRAMHLQVMKNNAEVFARPVNRLSVLWWKVKRKLGMLPS